MYKRIRIAYLDYSHVFAGAEQVLYTIISNLDRSKFEPFLIFPYPMEHQKRYDSLDCKKICLNDSLKYWMGSDRWKNPFRGTDFVARTIWGTELYTCLKKHNISILHVNLLRPDSLMWLLPLKFSSIKVVGHFRSQAIEWIAPKSVQSCCDLILCVSQYSRNRMLIKGEHTRSIALYDSIDTQKFHSSASKEEMKKKLGFPKDCFLITSVGQLSRHKGHDNAIKAFTLVAEHHPNAILYIAGGGADLAYLKGLAQKEQKISKRIMFSEKQVSNINEIYRASDLVLSLTKVGEAFGLVPYEATLLDAPFIGPDFGAIKEFVVDEENGLLVDTNNVKAISNKIEWVINHPNNCSTMIQNLQKVIHAQLTPLVMVTNLMREYQNLLEINHD